MNFFREYAANKRKQNNKQMIGGAIIIILFAAFAFGTVYLFDSRDEWDDRVSALEREVSVARAIRPQLHQEQATLATLQNIHEVLKVMDYHVNQLNFFTAEDAQSILETFPLGVLLYSFTVDGLEVEITGEITDITIFASMLENLEQTELFYFVTPSKAELVERTVFLYALPDGIYIRVIDGSQAVYARDGVAVDMDDVFDRILELEPVAEFEEEAVAFTITGFLRGGEMR